MIKICYLDIATMQILMLFFYIGFVIGLIYLMRAIFSIPTIVKNMKVQTKLLSEIAKANGVSSETIAEITNELK